jgi:hypothetical protein
MGDSVVRGIERVDHWFNVRHRPLAELPVQTFCTFPSELSSCWLGLSPVPDELSGVMKRPMIVSMPPTARQQQRYDHRLRHLVQRTGDVTVATDLGVPRSTARGWLGAAPAVVVCLDGADLTEPELRQELLKLRRRVQKLTALLRLALALLRTSGVRLSVANSQFVLSAIAQKSSRGRNSGRSHVPARASARSGSSRIACRTVPGRPARHPAVVRITAGS